MSIRKILKKEGIEITKKLDTLTVNSLAKNIATSLCSAFPNLGLDSNTLFINLSRLNMYFAKLPNGISAKYFSKIKTIYFDCNLNLNSLPDIAIHECIHYLQEKKDKKGNLLKLGLCDYTENSLPGVGLNEASVQLMASIATKTPFENVKYFGINLQTNTPTYYPLECALVNQMAYLIGNDVLFESTLNANNNFKNQYISLTSEKEFYTIQNNIDLLIKFQENLETLYSSLDNVGIDEAFVQKVSKEIEENKVRIRNTFVETQKLIITSYFDNAINLAYTPRQLENYRNKLYLFKNILGMVRI